jgi:hypothetical protein
MKKILITFLTTMLLVSCKSSDFDPYHCKPGDIDRDNDGRCHEGKHRYGGRGITYDPSWVMAEQRMTK